EAAMGTVEFWTLYTLSVLITFLRIYASTTVGVHNIRWDDRVMCIAILFYTAQCVLGYILGAVAQGLANDGMTSDERSVLSQDDHEYIMRVMGSKIQVAGWTVAVCLLWSLKLCVALFYLRLTSCLQKLRAHVHIAFGLVTVTFITSLLTIYLSCQPFSHYWQIVPNPGN
ncbi:hypothetical protein PtrSN002B_012300, partial [Pyrenophora tritici-repentis]